MKIEGILGGSCGDPVGIQGGSGLVLGDPASRCIHFPWVFGILRGDPVDERSPFIILKGGNEGARGLAGIDEGSRRRLF